MFVAHLAMSGLKPQTIKTYLSGLRHLQISAGLSDPFLAGRFPRLQYVVKGVKREKGTAARPRLPITPQILQGLYSFWLKSENRFEAVMLWAACTLAFYGFLRSGEVTVPSDSAFDPACHITPADIQVDSRESPSMLRIQLKQSKTDPFRTGVLVFIGRTGTPLYPVAAVLAYLSQRPAGQGPLFKFADGRALTRQRLVEQLRKALKAIGVDHTLYSGHSFRIGAATAAHAAGIEDSVIHMLGRWESDAVLRYIRTPPQSLAQFSQRLTQ